MGRRKPTVINRVTEQVSSDEVEFISDDEDTKTKKSSRSSRGKANGKTKLPEGTVMVEPESPSDDASDSEDDRKTKTKKAAKSNGDVPELPQCTACARKLDPERPRHMCEHPMLGVLICKRCLEYYTSDDFGKDEDGFDEQCRWCGEGGQLLICDFCTHAFCKPCVKRNIGRSALYDLVNAPDDVKWKCYVCRPSPLRKLQQECRQILSAVRSKREEKKRAKHSKTAQIYHLTNIRDTANKFQKIQDAVTGDLKALLEKVDALETRAGEISINKFNLKKQKLATKLEDLTKLVRNGAMMLKLTKTTEPDPLGKQEEAKPKDLKIRSSVDLNPDLEESILAESEDDLPESMEIKVDVHRSPGSGNKVVKTDDTKHESMDYSNSVKSEKSVQNGVALSDEEFIVAKNKDKSPRKKRKEDATDEIIELSDQKSTSDSMEDFVQMSKNEPDSVENNEEESDDSSEENVKSKGKVEARKRSPVRKDKSKSAGVDNIDSSDDSDFQGKKAKKKREKSRAAEEPDSEDENIKSKTKKRNVPESVSDEESKTPKKSLKKSSKKSRKECSEGEESGSEESDKKATRKKDTPSKKSPTKSEKKKKKRKEVSSDDEEVESAGEKTAKKTKISKQKPQNVVDSDSDSSDSDSNPASSIKVENYDLKPLCVKLVRCDKTAENSESDSTSLAGKSDRLSTRSSSITSRENVKVEKPKASDTEISKDDSASSTSGKSTKKKKKDLDNVEEEAENDEKGSDDLQLLIGKAMDDLDQSMEDEGEDPTEEEPRKETKRTKSKKIESEEENEEEEKDSKKIRNSKSEESKKMKKKIGPKSSKLRSKSVKVEEEEDVDSSNEKEDKEEKVEVEESSDEKDKGSGEDSGIKNAKRKRRTPLRPKKAKGSVEAKADTDSDEESEKDTKTADKCRKPGKDAKRDDDDDESESEKPEEKTGKSKNKPKKREESSSENQTKEKTRKTRAKGEEEDAIEEGVEEEGAKNDSPKKSRGKTSKKSKDNKQEEEYGTKTSKSKKTKAKDEKAEEKSGSAEENIEEEDNEKALNDLEAMMDADVDMESMDSDNAGDLDEDLPDTEVKADVKPEDNEGGEPAKVDDADETKAKEELELMMMDCEGMDEDEGEDGDEHEDAAVNGVEESGEEDEDKDNRSALKDLEAMMMEEGMDEADSEPENNDSEKEKKKSKKLSKKESKSPKREEKLVKKKSPLKKRKSDEKKKRNDSSSSSSTSEDSDEEDDRPRKKKLKKKVKKEPSKNKEKSSKSKKEKESSDSSDFESLLKKSKPNKPGPKCSKKDNSKTSNEDKKSKDKKKPDKKDDSESDLDKEIKKLTSKLRVGSAKKAQNSDEDSSADSSDAEKKKTKKDSGNVSRRGKKADSDSDVILDEEEASEESEESEDEEEESNTAKLLKELGGKVDTKKKEVESDEDISDLESDSDAKPKSKKGKGAKSKKASEDSESSAMSKKKKKEQFGKELLRGKLSESDSESSSKKRKSKRGKKDSDSDVVLSDSESGAKKKKKRKRAAKSSTSDSESGPGKKKRRRRILRAMSDSSVASDEDDRPKQKRKKKKGEQVMSEEEGEDAPGSAHKRKHIRKIMSDKKLEADTKAAAQEEEERRKRVEDRQKRYNEMHIDTEIGENKVPITTKLVLEFDENSDEENSEDGLELRKEKPKKKKKKKEGEEESEEEKEEEEEGEEKKKERSKKPLIQVDKWLIRNLKPHQVEAVKFMWNCTIESLEQMKKGEGSGCILAHCMGLGKTLSVITLVHTVLRHRELLGLKTCLVICPLNTVLNWQNEWAKWFEDHDDDDKVNVYEMSQHKTHHQRLACLKDWQHAGGVCIIGYEMFRNLAKGNHMRSKKMKSSFAECLLNPGPDMVVCDEGHILKNCESGLSKITSEIKSLRRIVLTGTPLQNNLGEYHCMVSFVKPRLLGTKKEFYNRFIAPIINGSCADSTSRDVRIMKKRAHVLHEMLNGCVQRRDYSALTPYLPPKFEYVVSVRLSPVQMELYQKYLDRKEEEVTMGGTAGARLFKDFQALMRIWTHPWVLRMHHVRVLEQRAKQELEESDEDFLDDAVSSAAESSKTDSSDTTDQEDKSDSEKATKPSARSNRSNRRSRRRGSGDGSDEEIVSKWKSTTRSGIDGALNGDDDKKEEEEEEDKEWWTDMVKDEDEKSLTVSGKLVILFEILKKAEEIGDKVLVFSQSLLSLDIIEKFLEVVDSAPNALTALNGEDDGQEAKGMGCTWVKGADYFRLDGSTNAFNRQKFCDVFNDYENPRARLFLISTRAGSLGINLVHANRVVVFDASWNPTYDVQSMFRVYRFGQLKPVYVYRLVAQGTMEEKIYERQVSKQSLSQRVVDEHQIDRHFNTQDLAELYRFDPDRLDDPNRKERPTPALPKDLFLADLLKEQPEWIVGFHEHDSLLENQVDQELTEEERKAAWEEYEAEKKGLITNPPPYMGQGGMSATDWLSHYGQRGASLPNYTNPMVSQMLMPPDSFLQEVSRQLLRQNPDMPPAEVMQRARGYWIRNLQVQELQKQQMLAAQQQELIRLHQMRQQQRLMEHQRLQQAQQEAARGKPSILKSRTSEGATMRSLLADNPETHVIPDD